MRIKFLSPGEMTADQKLVYDESIASKRGRPPEPMFAWLASPEMAKHATRLGAFLRYDTSMSVAESELAILVTARHWSAKFEWYAHKKMALAGGLDPKIIDDINARRVPVFDNPKLKVIYEVARSLHDARCVSQPLYDEALKLIGERGLAEVIGLCGYYTMVSMTLNTYEFGLPNGEVSDLLP